MMMVMMASVTIIIGVVAAVGMAVAGNVWIAVAVIVGVVAASIVWVAIARNVRESAVVWITTEVGVTWDATFVQVTDGTRVGIVDCKYLLIFEHMT